jgi:hypothetical protein
MGDETQKNINFGDKLSFILLSIFLNTSTVVTYIYITFNYISFEPHTLNVEFQHFTLNYN